MMVPATAKILLVFAGILVLSRLRLPLGLALVAGGAALDVWSGHPWTTALAHLGDALRSPLLWLFLAVTASVVEIGRHLTEPANAEAILAALRRWGGRHGRVWGLMAVPSVIGMVPMPAGALVSAPLVEQTVADQARSGDWKTAVNYWFRHTWEFWWPLYPAVIVAVSVFRMDTLRFVAAQIGYTPVSLLVGYLFLLHPHRRSLAVTGPAPAASGRRVAGLLVPLVVVIVGACTFPHGLRALWPGLEAETRKMLGMVLGLVVALAAVYLHERRTQGASRLFRAMREKKSLQVLFTVAGVMVFKGLLDRSGSLPVASRELVASGIPVELAVATLPLLAGLVTGIGVGFTGASFPLVVGLMGTEGSGLTPMATLVLAYGFGYAGMMLSPVHLCLVVSRDYFSAPLPRVYRHLLPCVGGLALFAVLMHVVFQRLGW
jgi:integral membrane protein (TIGR00529 family)